MSAGKRVVMAILASTCSLVLGGMPKIVSQTEKGVFSFTGSAVLSLPIIGNLNTTAKGTLDFYIDADMGSARLDAKDVTDAKHGSFSYLFSGKEKRLYTNDDGCSFMEFPALPEPAQYFGCVEKLLANGKKYFKDVYTIKDEAKDSKLGAVTLGGEYVLDIHMEKDGGIRNLDFGGSLDLLKVPAYVYGGGFNATMTSLAKPDASVFDVPAAWGECTKSKDNMDDFSKTEQAWLKCLKFASRKTLDVVLV